MGDKKSRNRHQHILSPLSVTNIDVATEYDYKQISGGKRFINMIKWGMSSRYHSVEIIFVLLDRQRQCHHRHRQVD